jgi:endoglucanase
VGKVTDRRRAADTAHRCEIGSRAIAMPAAALAGAALAFTLATVAGSRPALATTNPSVPLSIAIDGNHFVNGTGQTIRLLGVDRPGTEYACEEGWGDSDGDDTADAAAADAAAIASWDATAVRVPLNEDCWLGINGQPSYGTASGYRQVVQRYVADLGADGMYAILDLHWSAPGSTVADGQRPMPDDHSAAFWTSVADTFKADPAVLFDAFNEPYSPAADFSDAASYPLSWACWRDGGCTLPVTVDGTDPGPDPQTYPAVGMQALVDALRATGASQPILLGGLAYANDLSGWIAHEPTDPDHQLAASFHNYEDEACSTLICWNDEIAPVAAQVPVVTGEFDENECPAAGDGFDQTYMNWADQTGVSYLAWGWYVPTGPCDYDLVDEADAPVAPNGTALHDHLTALAAAQTTTTQTTTPPPATPPPATPPPATPPPATPPPATTQTTTTQTTTPPPATTPPAGTTKAVNEPPPRPCVVPRLTGDHLSRARRRLTASHCRVGRVSGRRGPGSVVATQHPRPGTRGRHGLRVALALKVRRHRPATTQAHRR